MVGMGKILELAAVTVELAQLPRTQPNTHQDMRCMLTSGTVRVVSRTEYEKVRKIFITNILEHFGDSTAGETKVALNLHESKIDVEFVHKIDLSIDPCDRRTYKHITYRMTAHADQPEPANPNPSKFHAQSSSSATMPSNQIIMDELFSLRGYISNQMDALDAQNQQIQYKLHCLSSKLSSMDIEEDISQPES
ncbi:hypothetical protein Lal_00039678 [Lupinus albus]|nr:hypothetical protein Lal_00039678 [Lupinus albus]